MQQIELKTLERYGFTDPASGKTATRKTFANQAIIIIGVDYLLRIFVLYAWAGRLRTVLYLDKIIDVCAEYAPRRFGVEANAMQSLFVDVVREKAKELRLDPSRIKEG